MKVFAKFAVDQSYSASHGQMEDYYWFESDGFSIIELLETCPEIVEGNYVVQTYRDSKFLVPVGQPPDSLAWERWREQGFIGIIADASAMAAQNNFEFYVYECSPDEKRFFNTLSNDDYCGLNIRSVAIRSEADLFWNRLFDLSPDSYFCDGVMFKFITRRKLVFEKLIRSDAMASLSPKRKKEFKRSQAIWSEQVGMETGPEKCANEGCNRLRIKLGVFCVSHHRQMLKKFQQGQD